MVSVLGLLIFILIIVTINILYYKIQYWDMTYVKSDIDNKHYLVRDENDKQQACNMLSKINENIFKLTEYVYKNKNKYSNMMPYIHQLNSRIKDVVIQENSSTSQYTSYSVNKGEKIVFCLRSKNNKKIHDFNLLMYIVIHEISHVACPEEGHTPLFNKIFAFLCQIAIDIKIYKKINFFSDSKEYCGMEITDSII
jgi:hypothetical protein